MTKTYFFVVKTARRSLLFNYKIKEWERNNSSDLLSLFFSKSESATATAKRHLADEGENEPR